jgi:hypothetical protein
LRNGVRNKNFWLWHGALQITSASCNRHAHNGSVSYSEQR